MLWRYELKKMLLTYRGLLVLAVCLLLKAVFLCAFPELKDSRILLSQKQYDKYLAQLQGEDTPEKSAWILEEYENCKQVRNMLETMKARYSQGEITEAEWDAYAEELQLAELHINSAGIFAEKAEQFLEQPRELPAAHYIYEYGWQTVYTLLQFPDIFFLFALVLLAAQCFSAEAAGGMLPVLLAARNGRRRLYGAKLLALATVALGAFLLSSVLEAGVFLWRGWCNDGGAPLYSVTRLTDCTLPLSFWEGYALCLGVRLLGSLLLAAMLFGLSVWVRSAANLIFLGLSIVLLPLLWNGAEALFTHGGLLSGTRMLLWADGSAAGLLVPVGVVAAYSAVVAMLAARRYQRGL